MLPLRRNHKTENHVIMSLKRQQYKMSPTISFDQVNSIQKVYVVIKQYIYMVITYRLQSFFNSFQFRDLFDNLANEINENVFSCFNIRSV